jgi:hypothetical protein
VPYPPSQTRANNADDAALQAAKQNYHESFYKPRPPLNAVNIWFTAEIWRVLIRLFLKWVGLGCLVICFGTWGTLQHLFPDADQDTLWGISVACGIFILPTWVVLSVLKTRRVRRERFIEQYAPKTMNERFVAANMIPNPPAPWYDEQGHALYERTPTGWARKTPVDVPAQPVRTVARGF